MWKIRMISHIKIYPKYERSLRNWYRFNNTHSRQSSEGIGKAKSSILATHTNDWNKSWKENYPLVFCVCAMGCKTHTSANTSFKYINTFSENPIKLFHLTLSQFWSICFDTSSSLNIPARSVWMQLYTCNIRSMKWP